MMAIDYESIMLLGFVIFFFYGVNQTYLLNTQA